ncbi:MAG: cyclase family protein [Armatimonadota bacterium]
MKLRDITGWIYPGMWSYCPEYPGAEISDLPRPAFLPDDYPVYLQRFVIGGQTGTYIETRAHVDPSAEPVTALPLDEFYRPVVVIDVGRKGPREPVTLADVKGAPIQPGDAVLLRSDWDSKWDDPKYVPGSPYIQREAALWLFDQGIGLLGSDFPCFDTPEAMQFPWAEFWARVNLLLAPVTNLTGLSGRCGHLLALPLKIRGACATPCRAVIVQEYS